MNTIPGVIDQLVFLVKIILTIMPRPEPKKGVKRRITTGIIPAFKASAVCVEMAATICGRKANPCPRYGISKRRAFEMASTMSRPCSRGAERLPGGMAFALPALLLEGDRPGSPWTSSRSLPGVVPLQGRFIDWSIPCADRTDIEQNFFVTGFAYRMRHQRYAAHFVFETFGAHFFFAPCTDDLHRRLPPD
jgi:hypothetical protein